MSADQQPRRTAAATPAGIGGQFRQLQAFEDAIRYRRARILAPCGACTAAPGGRCEDHGRDLDLITEYQQELHQPAAMPAARA